jgi:ribonuclease D
MSDKPSRPKTEGDEIEERVLDKRMSEEQRTEFVEMLCEAAAVGVARVIEPDMTWEEIQAAAGQRNRMNDARLRLIARIAANSVNEVLRTIYEKKFVIGRFVDSAPDKESMN